MRKLTPCRQVQFFSILTIAFLSILTVSETVFAGSADAVIRDEAITLRNQGIQRQNRGDLEGALNFYLQARTTDPTYAVIYNDLGVIYEAQGYDDKAEASYLRAKELDPGLPASYSNLALIYEKQRELKKAAWYWKLRAETGDPADPWTKKARERIHNIGVFPYEEFEPEPDLTSRQQQARLYRQQGLEQQRLGTIDEAFGFYRKALTLDPAHAPIYNDLGVIYEAKGMSRKAEQYYKKALNIDPHLASTYSNLASLYESRRDLKKAAYYWQKRKELGSLDDSWTQKAQRRYDDIELVLDPNLCARGGISEKEILDLVDSVSQERSTENQLDPRVRAQWLYRKALYSFKREDVIGAYRNALDAYQLDPENKEIRQFLMKVQKNLLSK